MTPAAVPPATSASRAGSSVSPVGWSPGSPVMQADRTALPSSTDDSARRNEGELDMGPPSMARGEGDELPLRQTSALAPILGPFARRYNRVVTAEDSRNVDG